MASELHLRPVSEADSAACLAIYRPNVVGSAISFEFEVPSEAEFAGRITTITERFPWFVAEVDGNVIGYAYASEFRSRAAYRWCCEVSVYVDASVRARGVARALYTRLLATLEQLGHKQVLGIVTLPNDASVALHESLGFRHAGTVEDCGFKLDRWHAIGIWQKTLCDRLPSAPPTAWLRGSNAS